MCTLGQLAALGIARQPTNHDTETVGAAALNPHWIATKKSTGIGQLHRLPQCSPDGRSQREVSRHDIGEGIGDDPLDAVKTRERNRR